MLEYAQKFNMNLKKIFALGSYTHDILFNTANVSKQKNKNADFRLIRISHFKNPIFFFWSIFE